MTGGVVTLLLVTLFSLIFSQSLKALITK